MIVEPELRVADFAKAGADIISVHCESSSTIHLHRTLGQIKELGCLAGVVLNPGTSLAQIEEVLELCDLVMLMSVNPGFGGQKFINSQVDKIRRLRKMCDERVRTSPRFRPYQMKLGMNSRVGWDPAKFYPGFFLFFRSVVPACHAAQYACLSFHQVLLCCPFMRRCGDCCYASHAGVLSGLATPPTGLPSLLCCTLPSAPMTAPCAGSQPLDRG